ncbi:Pre-mRNA 3'-end-processing factor FIP1 [Eumeta japonica]|uniref:Pre-mRNA 3'-end-processing factor FIP1 n=1 Tax=Eumeta variegata TaxID=151549 RepID=A0A4C1XSH3_EUMVA|nr:Pre-mRNA 3'-end-processing factor FIP1 [Eumeta japonica]
MAEAVVEHAVADENDDSWLYGDSNPEQTENKDAENGEKDQQRRGTDVTEEADDKEENEQTNDDSHFNDEHFAEVSRDNEAENGDADSQDNGDSDSDDSDDVKVTIGEIKSGPQAYPSLNIKLGVGIVAAAASAQDKSRANALPGSKVTLEDLEGPGSINGVPALEFNIDTIEDKPWNKPGADISDYFNYGFNEVTWSAYCDRQRRLRVGEAGVSMHSAPPPRPAHPPERNRPGAMMRNDEGMPPMMNNPYANRENTIQVMTADRREYGRRDAVPEYFPPAAHPPDMYYPPHGPPPSHHASHMPPHPHAHAPPYEEPWGQPGPGWVPTEIKELTPGPMGPPPLGPPVGMGAPLAPPHSPYAPAHSPAPPYRHPPPHERERERERERDRDRDRERDRLRERDERDRRDRERERREDEERERERERSRSIKPDRSREKSYRRERSRSRSRRHKSRSRSPRPRERERDRSRERSRERDRERERSVKPKKDAGNKDKEDEK